jgi:DNA-directed RNA polymerase subunit H (RpoH/RPB5)
MESKSSFLKQLYVGRSNLLSYLKRIGFECDAFDHFTLEEIDMMRSRQLLDFKVDMPGNGEQCYIKYLVESDKEKKPTKTSNLLKKDTVDQLVDEFFSEEDPMLRRKEDTLIVVTLDYAEDSVHKRLKTLWENDRIFMVVLNLNHLQFNIFEHVFVPAHVRLTETEKEELYSQLAIANDSKMPQISRFDPVARVILLRPGDVCKITRHDKLSGTNYYYRVCVQPI